MARRKAGGVRSETRAQLGSKTSTSIAASVSASVGRSRRGRDRMTRVEAPIVKVSDTLSRQWNRYSP
jgi:hypothetical protein